MVLVNATSDVLRQLQMLLQQMSIEEYNKPLPVLSGNSIGKHTRHILEFYLCLMEGMKEGTVNYDKRKRDLKLETELDYVFSTLKDIDGFLELHVHETQMVLALNLSQHSEEAFEINTSYFRELAYNIEHVIHHFALIKIGIESDFNHLMIPDNFGVASSTVKHQKECAQ